MHDMNLRQALIGKDKTFTISISDIIDCTAALQKEDESFMVQIQNGAQKNISACLIRLILLLLYLECDILSFLILNASKAYRHAIHRIMKAFAFLFCCFKARISLLSSVCIYRLYLARFSSNSAHGFLGSSHSIHNKSEP